MVKNIHLLLLSNNISAIGCATLTPPIQGWIQRTEEGAIVRCNNTKESWAMQCKGTSWVGEMRNCSDGKDVYQQNIVSLDFCFLNIFKILTLILFSNSLFLDKPSWGIEEFSGGIGLPSVGEYYINVQPTQATK